MNRQYKPDLSIKFSPRVPQRLRQAVDRLARRHEMLPSEIYRYCFEAGLLLSVAGKLRLSEPQGNPPLNCMISFHTTPRLARMLRNLHASEQERLHGHEVLLAYVIRRLLENVLPIAEERGMAWVMRLREEMLRPGGTPARLVRRDA